jgi:hypothetical protein
MLRYERDKVSGAAVTRFDADGDETRRQARNDGDVGIWAAPEPPPDLLFRRAASLERWPGDQRTHAARLDRDG